MSGDDVVIVAARRTPQGRLKGQLGALTGVQLGGIAIEGTLRQGGIPADVVDAVIAGHVLQAGAGQNPARQAAIAAGLPWSVHAVAVNKVCLSGLTAIIDATRLVASGDANVVVAAGMESMTRAPHLLTGSREGWSYGSIEVLDHAAYDGLTDAHEQVSMGLSTERLNERYGVTREEQDAVALRSHQRAAHAWETGLFEPEIVPVSIPQRRGEPIVVRKDEGIRPETTAEACSAPPGVLRRRFDHAGNSSQISDGASAVVLTTRARAERSGWQVFATVVANGQVAGPDNSLHAQPARAIIRACEKLGVKPTDLDLIEINEAFGAVVAVSQRELGVGSDVVNIHGGAIAIGHPIGASGNRLAVHAAHELLRRGTGRIAVAVCGGGGQGEAIILER